MLPRIRCVSVKVNLGVRCHGPESRQFRSPRDLMRGSQISSPRALVDVLVESAQELTEHLDRLTQRRPHFIFGTPDLFEHLFLIPVLVIVVEYRVTVERPEFFKIRLPAEGNLNCTFYVVTPEPPPWPWDWKNHESLVVVAA